MTEFTAFNGVSVANHGGNWDRTTIHFEGEVLGLTKERTHARDVEFEDRDFVALREFFQAGADERLGRWRWPENPDYVVYPSDQEQTGDRHAWVRVLHEPTSFVEDFCRHPGLHLATRADFQFIQAGRAYFDAHPEPEPKLWHDARPGEGWVIEIGEGDHESFQAVVVSNDGKFLYRDGGSTDVTSAWIRSGRRFHPEASE